VPVTMEVEAYLQLPQEAGRISWEVEAQGEEYLQA